MKIALIGYGKMGKIIEKIALSRGHEIVARIDVDNMEDIHSDAFRSADAAIEFTMPKVAEENCRKALEEGVPVVCGTTGWADKMDGIKKLAEEKGKAFFWTSNFSVGVNVFFAVNKYLAKIMNGFDQYDVSMTETHHIHKLDAPSGTAVTLAEGILENLERKKSWTLAGAAPVEADSIGIEAIREGEVPGIHTIVYDSPVDSITITHSAKSREGFALGAVMAAEFIQGKKGFLSMQDMMPF
ncbi:MAG: 4-hydroxy-tetrahydrodipicolinate reductase [Bacteroidetes bacterium]|uniref:4-hydroxy-tetrahydrodipicolinate reductase n=1 Tax=Candidatus Enterocola intestinipullorum TaxID=2840783 RepID=A0A9D9HEV1_9BACT|nr:4-hydroxy-tetrahydrodipicolinate reductase [Candidatus Enterocola intestinipullorum]